MRFPLELYITNRRHVAGKYGDTNTSCRASAGFCTLPFSFTSIFILSLSTDSNIFLRVKYLTAI